MQAALILIDFQKGFDEAGHWGGTRNNPDAEANALALLNHWRGQGAPVIFVRHASRSDASPLHPSKPGCAYKDGFAPNDGEPEVIKHENSSFISTELEVLLRRMAITDLVIAGISTEHCVSTTTRMAGNLGFDVRLVGDACHAWPKTRGGRMIDADTIHNTELAILDGEFCAVVGTSDITQAV